jgi:hypothetical protein
MARKHLEQLPDFRVDVSWPDTPTGGGVPLLDVSVGKLAISIQDALVTSYKSDKGDVGDELTIPLYSVAEWIAANWWALLFEPQKCDVDSDEDIGFRSGTGSVLPVMGLRFLTCGSTLWATRSRCRHRAVICVLPVSSS